MIEIKILQKNSYVTLCSSLEIFVKCWEIAIAKLRLNNGFGS